MSELSYEASDEASENELLDRSLSVWHGWSSRQEDITPIPLDIHTASSIGQYECVRSLINRGDVEIDCKNVGGWTPLMYACYIGHENIVNLLTDAGCNVNQKNPRGQTPLMLAASCGNESVGRFLLRKGAELEAADRNGWTALFHATYSGHQNFVSFLLDQRANMDAVEPSTGLTPFMEAAIEGHEIIVQLFLQHGVNVNAKAYNGDTARTLALMNSYMKIVSLIDNHVMPHSSLRSEPGLGDYLSSSDEVDLRQRPQHQRGSRAKSKGPSIRDGPEAIARMIDRSRYPHLGVPRGYMTFPHREGEQADTLLSYRDVTSPINVQDYHLDSSGGKDLCDYNDDSNAFSKTGAITIKSSSSSSGGLIAALRLSRQNSADSDELAHHDSGVHNSSQSEDNANPHPSVLAKMGEGQNDEREEAHSVIGTGMDVGSGGEQRNEQQEQCCSGMSGSHSEPNKDGSAGHEHSRLDDRVQNTQAAAESCHHNEVVFAGFAGHIPHTDSISACNTQPYIQFGDLVFPNILVPDMTPDLAIDPTGLDPRAPAGQDMFADGMLLSDRSALFSAGSCDSVGALPVSAGNMCVGELPQSTTNMQEGCSLFPGNKIPAGSPQITPSQQRHSSCHSRLSRLSVTDRDNGGVGTTTSSHHKEMRNRRRSANSPPTFHREYGGVRGQDLGSGTGRVSCLSDIPTSPGPQAGYLVTSSTRSPHNPIPPSSSSTPNTQPNDAVERFQAPFAAVAPACLHHPLPSSTGYPPPSQAFPSSFVQQKRKNSAPDISTTLCDPQSPAPVAPGYQSDGQGRGSHNHSRLSELVRELPPAGVGDGEGCGHRDLAALLEQLGLGKYAALFAEQDVDLQVFLSLTDNDLKEIGIKLFGPRKKMTNAIARWHSQAPVARSSLEQTYADRLEGEMQEMAIQLNQAYDSVEKLKAQVLQERQLRSVTESCLMEERADWQRVHHSLMDTHRHCTSITDAITTLSSLYSEIRHRVGQSQGNATSSTSSGPLTSAGPAPTVLGSDLGSLSTDQVVQVCEEYLMEVHQHSSGLAHSLECLISHHPLPHPNPTAGTTVPRGHARDVISPHQEFH